MYRWLRDGLEVKVEELAKPYKVVKRRGVKDPPGPHADPSKGPAEEEDVQEATSVIPVPDSMVTKMYGRWQTQQWQVPTAVGGVVPKNDRGNVHCPPLASELPKVRHMGLASIFWQWNFHRLSFVCQIGNCRCKEFACLQCINLHKPLAAYSCYSLQIAHCFCCHTTSFLGRSSFELPELLGLC